jgi:hypothetical protein
MTVKRIRQRRYKKPSNRMRPMAIIPRIRMIASNGIIMAVRVRTGIMAYPVTVAWVRSISIATVIVVCPLG